MGFEAITNEVTQLLAQLPETEPRFVWDQKIVAKEACQDREEPFLSLLGPF